MESTEITNNIAPIDTMSSMTCDTSNKECAEQQAIAKEETSNTLTVWDMMLKTKLFKKFVTVASELELKEMLQDPSRTFTIFAPTNDAFASSKKKLDTYSTDDLKSILKYHIVEGKSFMKGDLKDITPKTLNGMNLCIYKNGSTYHVNKATIIGQHKKAKNGIIHAINQVLIPTMDCKN